LTKQELKDYYWLKLNIKKLEQRIEELETIAMKQTSRLKNDADARVSHGAHDRMGDIVAEIEDLKDGLQEQLKKFYETMTRIEQAIEYLPAREQYLIRAKYIEMRTWEQIAVDMGYSWQHVHKIHSEALKLLA